MGVEGFKSGGESLHESQTKGLGITTEISHENLRSQEWGREFMQGSKGFKITNRNPCTLLGPSNFTCTFKTFDSCKDFRPHSQDPQFSQCDYFDFESIY